MSIGKGTDRGMGIHGGVGGLPGDKFDGDNFDGGKLSPYSRNPEAGGLWNDCCCFLVGSGWFLEATHKDSPRKFRRRENFAIFHNGDIFPAHSTHVVGAFKFLWCRSVI